jgi:hypothetical protein
MRFKAPLLLVGFALYASVAAWAAPLYVKVNASGTGDGSTWENALPGTWTPLRGGDYILQCGVYPSKTFSAAGTTRITIRTATIDDHGTDEGWDPAFASGQVAFGYPLTFTAGNYTLDGKRVGDPRDVSTYGMIVLKRSTPTSPSNPVQIGTGTQTIDGLEFRNFGHENWDNATDIEKIAFNQSGQATVTNLVFVNVFTRYCQNSIKLLGVNTATIDGLVALDPFSSASHHGEVINIRSLFGEPSRDVTVRNSDIPEWVGTGCIVFNNATTNDWAGDGVYIYANKFGPCAEVSGGNGYVTSTTGAFATNVSVMCNTLIGDDGVNPPPLAMRNSTGGAGSGLVARNNLYVGLDATVVNAGDAVWDTDHNAYYACTNVPTEANGVIGTGDPFVNLAGWDLRLVAGTAAIDSGTALPATFDTDPAGNTRGADGAWDIGAFEYVEGGDTTAPIVEITSPTSSVSFDTSTSPLTIGGTASDALGVTSVTWSNAAGGSGTATGTATWTLSASLVAGENAITVTAHDAAGNTGTAEVLVNYTPPQFGTVEVGVLNAGSIATP